MASIGQELKRERELRGISLKEIADSTRISIRFLRSLEEEQFEMLPGKFFAKGIIRAYAKYIGIDENAALNNYYETMQVLEQQEESPEEKREIQARLPRRFRNVLYFAAIFVVSLAILSSIHFLLQNNGHTTSLPNPPVQSVIHLEPPPQTLEQEVPVEPIVKELVLDLAFHQETWIRVFADGELKLEGIKQPGDSEKISAQNELLIHLGNAGGLSYTLNDKKGLPFGSPGEVRKYIRITLENFQKFQEKDV